MRNSAIAFTEGSDDALAPKERRRYAADACPKCGGTGTVFRCPEWDRSLGSCCPAGTTRHDCPGKSIACAQCGGTGRVA